MKQKILIRVTMTDNKTRAKAMNKAAQFSGVSGVEIKGDHRDQIEVTGVEVDMIGLTNKLREKVAFAELVSVTKVEPPKKPDPPKCNLKPCDPKPCDPKPCDPKPCYTPWAYGYGVPSSCTYPCNRDTCNPYTCGPYTCNSYPYDERYIGKPVYNEEPNCRIM